MSNANMDSFGEYCISVVMLHDNNTIYQPLFHVYGIRYETHYLLICQLFYFFFKTDA